MKSWLVIPLTLITLILVGCSALPETVMQNTPTVVTVSHDTVADDTAYPDPTDEILFTAQPATPYPDPATAVPPILLWAAEYVPEEIISHIGESHLISITSDKHAADLVLDVASNPDDGALAGQWVFVLVAPFPTITDGVEGSDFRDIWEGNSGTGSFAGIPLRMDQDTYGVFSAIWGKPSPEIVQVVPSDELLHTAWDNQPSWAIIPFEQLDPRWKVLQIDGLSPIHKDFDFAIYPLTVEFVLYGEVTSFDPAANFDPGKMSDILLTGVTALVRGTALTMERKGSTYPGEDIASITRQVDFMHVNNEVPFTPDCPSQYCTRRS